MTEIYVNHRHKKGIIIPCKCGSTAFGNILFMLDNGNDTKWNQFHTRQENRLAKNIIAEHSLSSYEFIGIARNPVEWYVSGFRFIQQQIKKDPYAKEQRSYWNFPTEFQEHLELIDKLHFTGINDGEYDEWWIDHCMLNPYMHFTENTRPIDLGDWNTIKQWFDSFFPIKHDFYIVNKTSDKIPYPILDYNNIFTLRKLYTNFWVYPKMTPLYNIDKSIKDYIMKR